MVDKRNIGIKVVGWLFIIFAILFLIVFPRTISSYSKLHSLSSSLPENMNFVTKISTFPMVSVLIVFLFFSLTGIGFLRIKRWAYYIALCMPFIYLVGIIKNVWFFGFQSVAKISILSPLFVSICILAFLLNKDVINKFGADYVTKRGRKINPKKFILWLFFIVALIHVISLCLWLWIVNLKFKPYSSVINLRPQKVEYIIQDEDFILNECEKRNIFDWSMYIPDDWSIARVSRKNSGFGWSLNFIKTEDPDLKAFLMLDSKGLSNLMRPMSEVLGFNSVYDFEKKISYPSLSPIYLTLKTIGSTKGLEGIDEATTFSWKGFIKIAKYKGKNVYDASLYSLKSNRTCGITLLFKEGMMTAKQARSIIASLEFKDIANNSSAIFEQGKAKLSRGDFTSASIDFMNALYIDERNPEYAYYLAQSLFSDNNIGGRKTRLHSSKSLLEYALELNPNYQEAKKLVLNVDSKIKQVEQTEENNKKE